MMQGRTLQASLFSWVVQQHLDPRNIPCFCFPERSTGKGSIRSWLRTMPAPVPAVPERSTRLMVGLMILKHRSDLSDEEVVQGLHENVVWMVFCGVPTEEAHFVESSTLCKFRKRLGPEGTEKVETLIREQLRKDKRIAPCPVWDPVPHR